MSIVKRQIDIEAPISTVWSHISDPDLLAGWLMRNTMTAGQKGAFQFLAQPTEDWDGVIHCKLIEFDPPNKIAFTWDANDIGGETVVTITLTESANVTHLTLLHANFHEASSDVDEVTERHRKGWEDHLGVLAKQLGELQTGRPAQSYAIDWTRFDLHVAIDADAQAILDRWRTSQGMESFFVQMMQIRNADGQTRRAGERAEPGDGFIWRWHDGRRLIGEYLVPESGNGVCFSFGESIVTVDTGDYAGKTILRLRQSNIPDSEAARLHIYTNCRAAWVHFLTCLKSVVENGYDCRDLSRETGAIFSTYFDPEALNIGF